MNKLKKSFVARPTMNLFHQFTTKKLARQKQLCQPRRAANVSFVKNARSKNAVTAIVYIILPKNVGLRVAAEKKAPMFFENAIEFAAG